MAMLPDTEAVCWLGSFIICKNTLKEVQNLLPWLGIGIITI